MGRRSHRHKSVINHHFKIWWRQAVTSFWRHLASSNHHFYPSHHWRLPLQHSSWPTGPTMIRMTRLINLGVNKIYFSTFPKWTIQWQCIINIFNWIGNIYFFNSKTTGVKVLLNWSLKLQALWQIFHRDLSSYQWSQIWGPNDPQLELKWCHSHS